jgi:GNAT superfamily N-acetyltransferase
MLTDTGLGGELRIRDATASDAPSLAAFAAEVFRDTYATTAGHADIEAHIAAHLHADAQAAEIAAAGWRTLLAEVDGVCAGYAQLSLGPAPAAVRSALGGAATALEIKRFYVARPWWGRGVAQRLMAACTDAPGPGTPIWLTVFTRNPRAVAFYAKSGFRIVGEMTFVMGQDHQRDHVMLCSAQSAS